MLIEVRKVNFYNKGAELMLRAIVEKVKEHIPNAKLLMIPPINYDSYLERGALGLYQKIWWKKYRIQWGHFGAIMPKKFRRMYGMILDSEVNVVLDASGFSYTDQWGVKSSKEAVKSVKKWKRQGTNVIFMPQAFGPFVNPETKKAFKEVVRQADMMYPRDKVSYRHLQELGGERDNIRIAPDFTNLIAGQLPIYFNTDANRFCIIPNYRMIDKTSEKEGKGYISFLIACSKYLYEKGAKPFILIHEGDKDLWLGQQVNKELDNNINIVRGTNALHIKGIIGNSEGVLSSRFHGLVSALSQGVPALATGWSHKYDMLFEDYGFPEGIISIGAPLGEIQDKIDLLLSNLSKQNLKETILEAAETQKNAALSMWEEVFSLIKPE